jgi:hypothetical protein
MYWGSLGLLKKTGMQTAERARVPSLIGFLFYSRALQSRSPFPFAINAMRQARTRKATFIVGLLHRNMAIIFKFIYYTDILSRQDDTSHPS